MFFTGGVILILGFVLFGTIPMNIVSESKQDDYQEQFTVEENITIQTESKPLD